MTLTPGAGEYLAVFSSSVENNSASSFQRCAIFVNGVIQAHTERERFNESSINNVEVNFATHAWVTVGAGEAVEIKWKTSGGTAVARNRTFNLFPVTSAAMSQATAAGDTTLATSTETLLGSMTLTPGAGDYLAVFSSSGDGPSGAVLAYMLYVGGTKVAHTERTIEMESSIANTEFIVVIAAKVSPTAGQAVEVRWARQSGSGTITSHERTLTLFKTDTANIKEVSATGNSTATNTASDALINTMTQTPGAGDYLALFTASFAYGSIGSNITTFHSIYVNSIQTGHTERQPVMDSSVDNADEPYGMTNGKVSPTAGQVVDIRWRASASNTRTVRERTFVLLKEITSTVEQEGYRFRNDDGSESAASWRQSQDVVDTIGKNVNIRLRTLLNATDDPPTQQYQLEYKETGDAAAEYRKVPLT